MTKLVPGRVDALSMKRLALVLFLGCSGTLHAWNSTGHKAIALIAYERLTPTAKQGVDQLLARHPDYPKWIAGVPHAGRGRSAFLAASVWPDTIRSDRGFHDDNRRSTSPIPGLPPGAQARHAGWHFTNIPFSSDGMPTVPPATPNIVTKLQEFASIGRMPVEQQVYLLPWVLRLIGNIHQPLHVVQRFTKESPKGDRGGNLVTLRGSTNLHSFWDSRLGSGESDRFLTQLATTIQRRHPAPQRLDMDPTRWAQEGFALKEEVYAFTGGTKSNPARLSDAYSGGARETAYARAALAGYRLAQFLNERYR